MQTGQGGEGQRFSKDQWQFTVRQQSLKGIDATMRIVHRGNIYDIRHIRPDGQYGWDMTLECEVQDIVVGAAPMIPAILTTIPIGTVGVAYSGFTVTVSGGTAPYSFSTESGGLPPGLDIDETAGSISGTPIVVGEWPCDIMVSDAAGASVPLSFTIVVAAASIETYAFNLTAGQDSSWVGFIPDQFGSVSADPIVGGTIQSVVAAKAVTGEGGIETLATSKSFTPR